MNHLLISASALEWNGIMSAFNWTKKKAEYQRIDAFKQWCWRRLLRVLGLQGDPTSEGNQS